MTSGAADPNLYGLITKERAEKFDLLGQLILNQSEAIVVCGAEGIGKTTLLNAFKKQRENIWIICLLQGLETLSFEEIQTQLVSTMQQYNPELANHDLQSALSFCEQQQKKIVLIIDDAGLLPAGLLTTLTEYALQNPLLRLVFAFTRKQLYLKNTTDRAVDDCYFMEIPSLTPSQITVFLQDSSTFSYVDDNAQTIDDKLLSKLYQRSDGVPGNIITAFPLLIQQQGKNSFDPLKSLLITGIALMSVVLFYFNARSHNNNLPNLQSVPVKASALPAKVVKKTDAHIQAKHDAVNVSDNAKKQPQLNKPTEPEVNNPVIQQDADEQWILQQGAGRYTLQLMALSKRQALLNIVKKHHNLEMALKILRVKNRNQEKYVLLYGAFADNKTAYAAVNSLPAEFKQAWPRKIEILQQEIKNRTIPLPKQLSSKQ